jgi:hypothetical protein
MIPLFVRTSVPAQGRRWVRWTGKAP